MNVSDIYSPPTSKRSADHVFVVKNGDNVNVHRYATREEAERERNKIIDRQEKP